MNKDDSIKDNLFYFYNNLYLQELEMITIKKKFFF